METEPTPDQEGSDQLTPCGGLSSADLLARLASVPKTRDGVPIFLGDVVYAENCDQAYFGQEPQIKLTVQSLSLGKSFSEYEGDVTVGGDDWEGGNLDCYSKIENVPNPWG